MLVFLTAIALNVASLVKEDYRLCSSKHCLVLSAFGCICVIGETIFLVYWSKRAKGFLSHWVELNEEWVIIVDNKDEH